MEAEALVAQACACAQRRFPDGTLDESASLHKTTWVWTRGHASHEDNVRCDWLARNAAATQQSSWADGRPHAPLRLGLGADYVPPKPQAS